MAYLRAVSACLLAVLSLSPGAQQADAYDAVPIPPDAAEAIDSRTPQDVADLRQIQDQLQRVLPQVIASTVAVQAGRSAGSGVVVSADGLVLTAGHVTARAGRRVSVVLPDGRRLRGRSLGACHDCDAGLVRLDNPPEDLPFVPQAEADAEPGDWVITTGHPGGIVEDRAPPVRLGRVLWRQGEVICTDCTLVGGDSGGPLCNLRGEVVGIHSSIGPRITHNFHVPIGEFRTIWERLLAGEVWGGEIHRGEPAADRPLLGVTGRTEQGQCLISAVFPSMPAEQAGVQAGDIVVSVGGQSIDSFEQLARIVFFKQPGDVLKLEVRRNAEVLQLSIQLAGVSQPLPGSPSPENPAP
jgi:serine protease Do